MEKKLKTDLEKRTMLSAKELIKKKALLEKQVGRHVVIDVANYGLFEFQVPTAEDILDAQVFDGGNREDEFLIYQMCVAPNLKNNELQEAYGCDDPVKIVHKIFEAYPGAVAQISTQLIKEAGYAEEQVKIVERLKNE